MAEWIIGVIEQYGYVAVALLMFAENVFPPVPSELIMPFAGFAAARGDLHAVGVAVAGTVGSLLGTLPWYFVARRVGKDRLRDWAGRHGRWLTVSPEDIDKAGRWFESHGGWAVFAGRLVPAVRSVISAPAGFAGMPLPSLLLWSAAGSLIWAGALMGLGYALEDQHEQVSRWLDPAAKAIVGLAVVTYVWRVVRQPKR